MILSARTTAALFLAGAVSVSLAAAPASATVPAKKKGQQTVSGKITWTVVSTYDDDGDASNPSNITRHERIQENSSLQINAVRDPTFTRTYVFKPEQAQYSYTYSSTGQTQTFGSSGLSCDVKKEENSSGSGKTQVNHDIFGKYNPHKDVLVIDKRTKGITVHATLPAKGTLTTTQRGFGSNPCGDGTDNDPVTETGGTGLKDSRWVCLPSGLKSKPSSAQPLFGKWNNKKKRFDFGCSKTFTQEFETIKLTVSGSLKYKK